MSTTPNSAPDKVLSRMQDTDGLRARVGLVLSGGGAKGAYQVGVLRYLADAGISVDAVSGASIGALNGALVAASGNLTTGVDRLEEVWSELSRSNPIRINQVFGHWSVGLYATFLLALGEDLAAIRIARGMFERVSLGLATIPTLRPLADLIHRRFVDGEEIGFLDNTPLHELLERYLNVEAIGQGLPLYVSVFPSSGGLQDALTATLSSFNLADTPPSRILHVQSLTPDDRRRAILASAALPFLFAAQKIGDERFTDGGQGLMRTLQGNTPAEPLVREAGCSVLIVTHLSDGSLWDARSFADTLVMQVRPRKPIRQDGTFRDLLGFTPKKIQPWIQQGYDDAEACLTRIFRASSQAQEFNLASARRRAAMATLRERTDTRGGTPNP